MRPTCQTLFLFYPTPSLLSLPRARLRSSTPRLLAGTPLSPSAPLGSAGGGADLAMATRSSLVRGGRSLGAAAAELPRARRAESGRVEAAVAAGSQTGARRRSSSGGRDAAGARGRRGLRAPAAATAAAGQQMEGAGGHGHGAPAYRCEHRYRRCLPARGRAAPLAGRRPPGRGPAQPRDPPPASSLPRGGSPPPCRRPPPLPPTPPLGGREERARGRMLEGREDATVARLIAARAPPRPAAASCTSTSPATLAPPTPRSSSSAHRAGASELELRVPSSGRSGRLHAAPPPPSSLLLSPPSHPPSRATPGGGGSLELGGAAEARLKLGLTSRHPPCFLLGLERIYGRPTRLASTSPALGSPAAVPGVALRPSLLPLRRQRRPSPTSRSTPGFRSE
ncbi:hypothetical protein PVAP13_2NG309418 [Panicum virgatum]|uniref:Uncharacterized protein n=1 Tax=Panicum virgatum TaxID=38727 RepID=A0A8T0VJ01_PANVG|nr:hypothetical protein PVAP13_2NG309418 [Panicum virgatum]